MDNLNKKCSFKDHQEVNANSYCRECKIFMCNKCEAHHSSLFLNHEQFNLIKNNEEIFTGFCLEKEHNNYQLYLVEKQQLFYLFLLLEYLDFHLYK